MPRPMSKEEEDAALRRQQAMDEKEKRDQNSVRRSNVDMATPIDILENHEKNK